MKKLIVLLTLVISCLNVFGQANPVLRNRYTTNQDSAQIDGSNLTNLNIAGGNLRISNAIVQILNLFPTNVTAGVGTLSSSTGSHFWTNAGGGFGNIAIGDNFIVNVVHQFLVVATNMGAANVLFTFTASDANYTNVAWQYSPNSMNIYDTIPRIVGSIGNDGAIIIVGHDDGFANSGALYLGGTTNFFKLQEENDTSGSALLVKSALGGTKMRIYDSSVALPLDVTSNGPVYAKFGFGSIAAEASLTITGTGLTNSYTNNVVAWVTGGAFTNFDHFGTAIMTNVNTVTNFPVNLQPGGSVVAASGLSGKASPW